MRDGQKGTRGILIFCIAAMGLHLMGQGFSALRENGWEKGKALAAAACLQAGSRPWLCICRGRFTKNPREPAQEIQASARGQLPYFSFAQSQEPKESVVEDDTTIQAMIQENERRIAERIREENSREAAEEENQRQQGSRPRRKGRRKKRLLLRSRNCSRWPRFPWKICRIINIC